LIGYEVEVNEMRDSIQVIENTRHYRRQRTDFHACFMPSMAFTARQLRNLGCCKKFFRQQFLCLGDALSAEIPANLGSAADFFAAFASPTVVRSPHAPIFADRTTHPRVS
jgi:hypothetical protein